MNHTALIFPAALLLAAGCGGGGETREVVVTGATGTLVVDWTVDGAKAPSECQQGGATTLDVTVQTASGADAGEFQADCESFSTSIDLPSGSYTATAVLIDPGGADRTTPIDLSPFRIHGDDVLTTPIDFPSDSFL